MFCPNATLAFAEWLKGYPQASLNDGAVEGAWNKYDIKPLALLTLLRRGFTNALWIDSDILIASDFRALFSGLRRDAIVVAEEALSGGRVDPDGIRARLWGMPVGRRLPLAANTAVIRVTDVHIELLEEWANLLESSTYREAQQRPWTHRAAHVMGDQEVLTALLTSSRFSDLPLEFLRRGRDIIQYFGMSGYTVTERLRHIWHGPPYFVHSQGYRPWLPQTTTSSTLGAKIRILYNQLSPYTALARSYSNALENSDWLSPSSGVAQAFTTAGGRCAPLVGFPLAILADIVRAMKLLKLWSF